MKFNVSQAEFLKGLTLANKSLLTKANLPILSNILVTTTPKQVEIVSTNLETATRVTLNAKVATVGETTILGRAIGEFVQQLDSSSELSFEKLGEEAVVVSGNYNARFATMDSTEFPAIPKVSGGVEIKIKAKDLAVGIAKVAFCAAQDESRPILTGVLCEITKNNLNLVATDGYRLGFCQVGLEKGDQAKSITFIVPAKALSEVAKIIGELGVIDGESADTNLVTVLISDNLTQAVFTVENVEFTSRLIEGEFPAWQKIIPATFATKAAGPKTEFMRVVKMASIFARESGNIIKLNLAPLEKGKATLAVNAVTAQVGSASGTIDVTLEGKGGEIAFNYRYLLDVFSVFEQEEFVFEMNESLNPGKITSPSGGDNSFHIIMPVRLQG